MPLNLENITAEEAYDRSGWCSETVKELNDRSLSEARSWWENECDRPAWLGSVPTDRMDMHEFAQWLQAEGYRWAEAAGTLYAEEDSHGEAQSETAAAVERVADYFVGYLFDRYQGTRHVRRVATWLGFLLKAIERIAGESLARSRSRQITFTYRRHNFKARFNHQAGARGGIEIVEVLPGRGAPEGGVAVSVTNLSEAEDAYRTFEQRLDTFIDGE